MTAIEFMQRASIDPNFDWYERISFSEKDYEDAVLAFSRALDIPERVWLHIIETRPDRMHLAAQALYILQQDTL